MAKMMGMVVYAPNDNRYEEVEIPKPGPGEMLIKIKACGVCASDTKSWHGGKRVWGDWPGPNHYMQPGVVGGHEFFGEIVELGEGVTDFEIGDVVAPEQIVPCDECKFCREGNYWMCEPHAINGFRHNAPGGFAEYTLLSKHARVHKLPKDFPIEKGALIEPYGCAMHAVERAQLKHTDVLVVSGLGAIGLAMINIATKYAPKLIIGVDLKKNRLEKGLEFGADLVLNPLECDVIEEIKKLTDGYGADAYIEASGSVQSIKQGMDCLRKLGKYVQFGIFADDAVPTDMNTVGDGKELDVLGAHLSPNCFGPVIKGMIDGSIKTDGIVTHVFKIADWEKGFNTALSDPDAIKVVLVP